VRSARKRDNLSPPRGCAFARASRAFTIPRERGRFDRDRRPGLRRAMLCGRPNQVFAVSLAARPALDRGRAGRRRRRDAGNASSSPAMVCARSRRRSRYAATYSGRRSGNATHAIPGARLGLWLIAHYGDGPSPRDTATRKAAQRRLEPRRSPARSRSAKSRDLSRRCAHDPRGARCQEWSLPRVRTSLDSWTRSERPSAFRPRSSPVVLPAP